MARPPKTWRIRKGSPLARHIEVPEARDWFRITNQSADVAEVRIADEVGMWGVTASDFSRALEGVTAPSIVVRINSPGGEVADATAIHSALVRHPAKVTTVVDALAASAASFIAQAGDRRLMVESGMVMIHEAQGLSVGDAADMRAQAEVLDRYSTAIAKIYAGRAGGTVDGWRRRMKAETWFDADEAVAANLVDEIGDTEYAAMTPAEADPGDYGAQLRAGLAAAAARLPPRPAEAPEGVGMAVADALHNAFERSQGSDIEWHDGEPLLTTEAANRSRADQVRINDAWRAEQARKMREGLI